MKIIITISLLLLVSVVRADEGMWLVHLMNQVNYATMKQKGLNLTAEQIYSETTPSIKDAVVALDYGSCTGSVVSKEGLLITNHHCAYDDIQKLSTLEHDYLHDGFYAKEKSDEIAIPGKSVMFLRGVLDITEEFHHQMDSFNKGRKVPMISTRKIDGYFEHKYQKPGMEVSCVSMLRGDKVYIFYYEVYKDIRLVAAPPCTVGAFGGDTDNWSWPQHKGDFSLYRIYGAPDGSPAKYSSENVPLSPRYVLPVSIKGVKEGDYTMILGFPGKTNRYLPAAAIQNKLEVENPHIIDARREKLEIMSEAMKSSNALYLAYASKHFMSSNLWKFTIGESKYSREYDVIGIKRQQEKELTEWINADASRVARYGNLISDLNVLYDSLRKPVNFDGIYKEAIVNGADVFRIAMRIKGFVKGMNRKGIENSRGGKKFSGRNKKDEDGEDEGDVTEYNTGIEYIEGLYKDYDEATDKKLFCAMFRYYVEHLGVQNCPESVQRLKSEFKGDYAAMTEHVYRESYLANKAKFQKKVNSKKFVVNDLNNDILYKLTADMYDNCLKTRKEADEVKDRISYLRTLYVNAMLEKNGSMVAPDANSTMRVTYGNVGGYVYGGERYPAMSDIGGYFRKYKAGDIDFDLRPDFLAELQKRDWGRYADADGVMNTGFIGDMDITGGNSGSPVMNADGALVGLAYDGNWESMTGDLYFHPEYNKCVSVDIRFVLWILDKYMNADNLLKEMNIAAE